MGNPFRYFCLVDWCDLCQIAASDDARGQEHLRICTVVHRIIAIGHVIADAGAERCPILVEGSNGDHVRDIDAADEGDAIGHQVIQGCDRVHIERCLRVGIDRRRHAADKEALQVRILSAQNGMDLDEATLPVERLQVMRHAP